MGSSSHFTKLVTSSDPHGPLMTDPRLIRSDRPVPHSLSSLLTPTRAPHARLLKHWEGRIVSLLALVRHPHAHSLASSLVGSHASSLAHFISGLLLPSHASALAFFPSLLRAYTLTSSLALLHTRFFPRALTHSLPPSHAYTRFLLASRVLPLSLTSLSEWTSNSFYICGPSWQAQSPPKLTPPHLRTITMTTRRSKKGGRRHL